MTCTTSPTLRCVHSRCTRKGGYFIVEAIAKPVLLNFQLVTCLQVQPESLRSAKVPRQPQRCISRDRTLAADNFVDPTRWDRRILCEPILADSQGCQELFQKDFARVDGG